MKFTFPILTAIFLSCGAQAQVQKINTIAGTGVGGFSGDGGVSTAGVLHNPQDVKLDALGNVYIMDYTNFRIRKINTAGNIITVAGNGVIGNTGDGSISTSASMWPTGIAIDRNNLLYIADGHSGVIRKVNSSGIISRVAGIGAFGNAGNGGPATLASVGLVQGIAFDTANNLYVADAMYHVIRKISASGIITRFAGTDTAGYTGDGGSATTARIDSPFAIVADREGNVYFSDMMYHVVRMVNTAGVISTYAGTGTAGNTGDGGMAVSAQLNRPAGLAVDTAGNLFIADADNNVIRKIEKATGIISRVVGNGTPGFGGDLGYVNGCNLHTPFGVAVATNGDIYIADANNQRVRKTYATVGVTDTKITNIELYPNPTNGTFIVTGASNGNTVIVYDYMGRQVANSVVSADKAQLDLTHLPGSVYVVRVIDAAGNTTAFARLVKE